MGGVGGQLAFVENFMIVIFSLFGLPILHKRNLAALILSIANKLTLLDLATGSLDWGEKTTRSAR